MEVVIIIHNFNVDVFRNFYLNNIIITNNIIIFIKNTKNFKFDNFENFEKHNKAYILGY